MPEVTISIPDNVTPDAIEAAVAAQTKALVEAAKAKAAREQRIAGLHAEVAKLIGEPIGSTDALIALLVPHASAKIRRALGGTQEVKAKGGRRPRTKVDAAFAAKVKGMIADGKSKLAIARELNVSYSAILKAAKA